MNRKSIRAMFDTFDQAALKTHIDDWRAQLLSLRLSSRVSHVRDYSQFKKLRKNIARGMQLLQHNNSSCTTGLSE